MADNTDFSQVKLDTNGTYGAYNDKTGEGIAFSTPGSFQNFFGAGATPDPNAPMASFDTSKITGVNANRMVSVALNPSATTNSNVVGSPVTNTDVESLIKNNQDLQQKVLGYYAPTADEIAASAKLNGLETAADKETADYNDEVKRLGIQPGVTTAVATAQQNEVARQHQYNLQTNAVQQNATARVLQTLQSNRQAMMSAAEKQVEFGQNNISTRMQLNAITKQEQQTALKFALDYNVKTPYFQVGQTVYSSANGQPFSSEADFKQKTGMDIGFAAGSGRITNVNPQLQQEQAVVYDLMSKYPDAGIRAADDYATAVSKLNHSAIYQKSIKSTSSSSGFTSGNYKFTSTQFNKGANNAGVSVEDFKKLDPEVQNFFVSSSAKDLSAIDKELAGVASGDISLDDFNSDIESLNHPDQVTNFLKDLGKSQASAQSNDNGGAGFWGSVWNGLQKGFGGISKWID